jgi:putative FmdB family regulatory protein
MPIFEYKCEDCGKESEILLRSQNEKPKCECGSTKLQKLLSVFAVNEAHSHAASLCASGDCGMPQAGGCPGGMCGF